MARSIGIGFGLERLGVIAKRWPVAVTLLLLVVSALAASQIPNVRFDGNVTSILPEETRAYKDYFEQKRSFRDASRDITILLRSPRLMTAEGMEDLRFLHLELSLAEPAEQVVSIFSVPDPDPETGELGSYFPNQIETDRQARELVAELADRFPQAARLIAPEANLAILIVALDASLIDGDAESYTAFYDIQNELEALAPDDFEVLYTGITPIGATIVTALVTDQLRLTIIGLALGTAIAFYIFRSLLASLICAIPPALTALWSLGLLGYLQIPITYLTTVLPTLALILAFADGIVLYFRWQSANAREHRPDDNLLEAVLRVGPASALTSVTTVLAFLSFSFASGTALKEFSMLGMSVVSLAFLSVILGIPVAGHWAIRAGLVKPGRSRKPAFGGIGSAIHRRVSVRPLFVSGVAVVLVVLLTFVHAMVKPEFRITDYLPYDSDTRQAEDLVNDTIGGRSPIFVTVPKAAQGEVFSPENLERLRQAHGALVPVFGEDQVYSALDLADAVTNDRAIDRIAEQLQQASDTARSGLVSSDDSQMLVTAYITSDQAINTTLEQISQVRSELSSLDWGESAVLTGFDVLMADEFTVLIEQLRTSLLIAIFLGIAIVGLATGSPLLAIAAITPNLLPIFAVELVIWLKGGTVNLSEVIALTISFGIAIDNAVHVINVFNAEKRSGRETADAVREAMAEVGPALGASTAIICVSCVVTQLSILPVVPVLGRLMIATLFVAFLSNLAILPANILTLDRWKKGVRAFIGAQPRNKAPGE